MILVKTKNILLNYTANWLNNAQKIGFVPTMGALHKGHISLIDAAKQHNNIVVSSIFINPTQFNNTTDLQKYPVTIEADISKLEKAGCDVLFLPTVAEMYPTNEPTKNYELGYLETILEGSYRPGHFQGVCTIVDKLLGIVQPTTLYLGRKDYQQCMVIQAMMQQFHKNVALQICDTVREQNGLAMSSRNMRLNETERLQALKIIESLTYIKHNIAAGNLINIKANATLFLQNNGYKVDYTEIADAETLKPVENWNGQTKLVALVAAYLNDIRLIDNILL